MNRILKSAFACLAAVILLAGCQKEKEDQVANLAPETTVSVKDVTLADEATLTTTVHLYWSGSDQDGYVRSYQISLDGQNWSNGLSKTDSLFRFSFPAATDTSTIHFYVRSIDDKNLADPTPAIIKLPLRNSPPTAAWDADLLPFADTLYTVTSLSFRVADPDGSETLDSIFVRLNDEQTWFAIPKNSNIISFVPESPGTPGVQQALVYLNGSSSALPRKISGLKLNDWNTFQLKGRDIAQAESNIATIRTTSPDAERSFYIKAKTADLLVLASNQTTSPDPDVVYAQAFQDLGIQYDRIDFVAGRGKNQPRLFDNTMSLLMGLYPKVFWYMDLKKNASSFRADSSAILVETVAPLLNEYLNSGGKLLLTSPFPTSFTEQLTTSSPVFGLLPVDSIPYKSGTYRMRGLVQPKQAGYPDLSITGIITGASAIYPSASADTLYVVPNTTSTTDSVRTKVVAVRGRNNQTQQVNLIFFSMEMQKFLGDPVAARNLFDKIFNQDFNQ